MKEKDSRRNKFLCVLAAALVFGLLFTCTNVSEALLVLAEAEEPAAMPQETGETAEHHAHRLCGDENCTEVTHNVTWEAWNSTNSLPTTTGNYYLTQDVKVSEETSITSDKTVSLCLNGHSVTMNGSGKSIYAVEGTLNLSNCKTGGTLTGVNSSSSKAAVRVHTGGTFNMYGGTISGNTGSGDSAGVYVASTSSAGGTFNMYGGTISSNTAKNGGGVYVNSKGTFTMHGGTILRNEATLNGGGVYVNGGTFKMENGTISGNKATSLGGGVYVVKNGNFIMNGGTIGGTTSDDTTCNTANHGGGICLWGDSSQKGNFTMSGGTISSNKATNLGGGVYIYGTFKMENGTISGSKATNGGGVYVDSNGTFKMENGTISNNTAASKGGGVYAGQSFTIGLTVNITGNKKTDKSENNVFLTNNKKVTIGSSFDAENSNVGVTTETAPTCTTPVTITGTTDKDLSGGFTSDNTAYYKIKYEGNAVKLSVDHNYTYKAEGAVITESCDKGCGHSTTVTLSVKEDALTYTGSEIKPVTVNYGSNWKGSKNVEITYENNTGVGTATASLTISEKTASLNFSIEAPEASWKVSEGETQYGTLEEALNAAEAPSASNVTTITVWDGMTAVLTTNHTLPEGATLIVPMGSKVVSGADGVVLTVKGTIKNAGSFDKPIRLDITKSGTLINTGTVSCDIKSNAGMIKNTGGTISGNVENTEDGTVEGGTVTGTVTKGTVKGPLTNNGTIKDATITGTIDLLNGGEIIDSVINGTVIDKGGKVSYTFYREEINGTGVITAPGGSVTDPTPEQKLAAALGGAAVKSSDGTVKLVADVDLTRDSVIININGDMVIDLNGHTITAPGGKPAIQIDGGNVTIQDTSVTGSGAILGGSGSAGQPGAPGIRNTGSGGVTIKGGTVSGGTGGESGGKGGDGIKNTGSGKVDITEGGKVEKGSDGSSGNSSSSSGGGNSSVSSGSGNSSGGSGGENISGDSNRENISSGSGWGNSGDTGTWIETKPDGTRVETTTGTRPDGTKTETVTETKPDGTKTETVTETKPDGTKTETVTETKLDGTKMQIVTETKSDGTKMQTVTETKLDGTKTQTVTETKPDGTKTQTVVKTKADGTKTETVAETKPNGAKTETVVKTKPDGVKTENVTKTNASGEVVKITEKVTSADGVLTSVKETSPVPGIAKNTAATVTVQKDGKGKITSAKASVTYQVKKGKKAVFSADVMAGVVEAAGTESVDVTMTVRDSKGKTKYKVQANTEDLAAGEELYIYRINPALDEYEMVNPEIYKANKKGNVAVAMDKKTSYVLVNSAQSEQIASEIVETIQPESKKLFLKKKQKTRFELDSEVNENNIKSITYSTEGKPVVTVSKKGRITGRKRGKTVVKAKVVLLNGMTKTINMKIIVK